MTPKYLSLKTAKTTKIGERTKGYIHYRVLSDQDKNLYFNITGNDDLGYYSKEVIPFEMIEHVVKDIEPNVGISSSAFKKAFVGQSNNNAAFLSAILRNEKLLSPMTDAVRKHTVEAGWDGWKTDMLKLAAKAKPFEPEVAKVKKLPTVTKDTVETAIEDSEMTDEDYELLQPK